MEKRLIELALQRGRLQERIAGQRTALAGQMQPLAAAVARVDQGLALARAGGDWVRRHPMHVGAAVALLALLKPRRLWRWGRRALILWGMWQRVRPQADTLRALLRGRAG